MYFFVAVLLVSACLVGAGVVYQWLGARRDRQRYTRQGRWIKIDPRCELYLLEQGSGGPTVIFESGIAATNLNWIHIQQAVSHFTHTVSYDRGGLGWSSAGLTLRTPANIATELHTMLERAGLRPPFLLVGHSFGGLVMRRYAVLFPEQVCGLVLVDPMRPEEWPPIAPSKQHTVDRGVRLAGYGTLIARVGLARLAITSLLCRSGRISTFLAASAGHGGTHVLARVTEEVSKMPREVWPIVAAHWSRPGFYAGMASHVRAVPDTVREMQGSDVIQGIPVLLLTPGTAVPLSEAGLRAIGDNVQQVIAKGSAHWVHLDEPDLVIDAIRDMVLSHTAQPV